jgi:hypothetical protein
MKELDNELRELAFGADQEFADIADYIWKAPKFIESEIKIELKKLDAYFPLTGASENDDTVNLLRRMRWQHESRKLGTIFPYVMANGNLFTALSVFESYCLMLCKVLEKRSSILLSDFAGSGISRYFKFLSRLPIDLNQLAFRSEVRSAIVIRNCLFHANGMLEWSRDKDELLKIVGARTFLSKYTRSKTSEREAFDVGIVNTDLGDQLQITNNYSHVVTNHLKFHFIDLCKRAQLVCNGRCTIDLPTTPYYVDKKATSSDASPTKQA